MKKKQTKNFLFIEELFFTGFQFDSIIAVSIRGSAIAVPFN
jgi:hypothetical protein